MNISKINTVKSADRTNQKTVKKQQNNTEKGIEQFSSAASNATMAYGLAKVSFGSVQKVESVQNNDKKLQNETKTINLFYFGDTHGELTGLPNLLAAKEACEEFCGGNLSVLGAGDLIAGSQTPVINATVDIVNEMDMQANALGNHERSRSDAKLKSLADELKPELLAINASDKDKSNVPVKSSIVCQQGDNEFITIGATPLSPVQDPKDIAVAIDNEVAKIKKERSEQGLSTNLPVVLLSHMGSNADKITAENSETIDLILGGHTHNVEEYNYTSKDGRSILTLQGGSNNAYATVIKMDIASDGTIKTSAKMLDLKKDVTGICNQLESFYGTPDLTEEALVSATIAENNAEEIVADNVGPKKDVAYVPEGQGYINDGKERNYSNPVSNILADAILSATSDMGVQVSFFNAPSLKDTGIPDEQTISNYDVMGRMIPFGGEVAVADVPVNKFYDIIEKNAQGITTWDSQLVQCAGMTYSVNAEKAKARYNANIGFLKAEDNYQKALKSGDEKLIKSTLQELAVAKEQYENLPKCVEKILILNRDGSELKVNPKAVSRGDFDGQSIKCATNDFFAHQELGDGNYTLTPLQLTEVFQEELSRVREQNDDVLYIDQNDVRISIKDSQGLINGYAVPTGLNTKYWYNKVN